MGVSAAVAELIIGLAVDSFYFEFRSSGEFA
jgi:hypothetical protein